MLSCAMNNFLFSSVTPEQLQEFAIKQNGTALMEILMQYKGNCKEYPILNRAMEEKDYFAVFILVEYGIDIDSRFESVEEQKKLFLLTINSEGQEIYMTTCIEGEGKTVLESAIESGEISLVEYFLLNKADPTHPRKVCSYSCGYPDSKSDYYNTTAIYDAIMLDRLDVLLLFAHHGADFNKACIGSYTPIQLAISEGKRDIVAFLISIGVDI